MTNISVLIPTYNRRNTLIEAIKSVLNQTYQDFEIIIIDDGSQEPVRKIIDNINDTRIKYIYQENSGVSVARNTGLNFASGDFISFLDDDDRFLPRKLEIQVKALIENPEFGAVVSGHQVIDEGGEVVREEKPWKFNIGLDLESTLFKSFGITSLLNVLFLRTWIDNVHGFDPILKTCQDMDLWYRLLLAGCRMKWIPEVLSQYRIHKQNISHDIQITSKYLEKIYDNLFTRHVLPSSIYTRKGELYARLNVIRAMRYYEICDFLNAKKSLNKAIEQWPKYQSNEYFDLFMMFIHWQNSIWVRNKNQYLKKVMNNLPQKLKISDKARRNILATGAKSLFFDAYWHNNFDPIRKYWMQAIALDPLFLLNRGGWSIIFKSLINQYKPQQEYDR